MRLIANGCKVSFGKDKFKTFGKVKTSDDIITTEDGQRIPKPIIKTVWLVTIRIPKQLLDVSEDIKDIDDVDYDSVEAAYDEELDGEQGLQNDDNQASTQGQNGTQEVQA